MAASSTGAARAEQDSDGVPANGARSRLLVVEDDTVFARVLCELAEAEGFEPVIASRGDTGLAMARQIRPAAVTVDVRLPGVDGWVLLDRMKHERATRHVPVCVISGDERRARALRFGARWFVRKPASREDIGHALAGLKRLGTRAERAVIVAHADEPRRRALAAVLASLGCRVEPAETGARVAELLRAETFDALVLGSELGDDTPEGVLRRLGAAPWANDLPVVLFADSGEGRGAHHALADLPAGPVVVCRTESPESLCTAIALLLHRPESELPPAGRTALERRARVDPLLEGRRVLVVDDDVRNTYALTSLLQAQGMEVLSAGNGRLALDVLAQRPDVDLVLMDIMMPEMDGHEAIRAIRSESALRELPVVALTARAMKGDRDACLRAGATDYLAKPVDSTQLLSMVRVALNP